MKSVKPANQNNYLSLTAILISFLLMPVSSLAQHHEIFSDHHIDADVTDRLLHDEAEYAMTTREGSIDLLVAGDAILIQFSDRFLEDLAAEIHNENDDYEEASVLADVITSMVSSGVRSLLDHALAIPIVEISEVFYEDGRLYIVNKEGSEYFENLEIDDVDVMEDFARRDARRFVDAVVRKMP